MFRSKINPWIALLIVMALFAASCSSGESDSSDDEQTTTTAEREVVADADFEMSLASVETSQLVGELTVAAAQPVTAEVEIRRAGESEVVRRLDGWEPATDLRLPVVGMVEETPYDVTVQLLTVDNELYGEPETFEFETAALPEDLPAMSTEVDPEAKAPGDTLFNLLDLQGATDIEDLDIDRDMGHLLIVNEVGEIIWYYRNHLLVGDVKQLPSGNILTELGDLMTVEVNLFGEIVGEWAGRFARADVENQLPTSDLEAVASPDAVPVDADAFHHEHTILPSGNHLALSSELETIEGFTEPLCGEDPATFGGTYDMAGDRVIEFDPDSGEIVKDFSMYDYFDPRTDIGLEDVCNPVPFVFPNTIYTTTVSPDIRDWTHSNAVVLDEARNALIISVRHLDTVLAIRYSDDDNGSEGDLLWKLGPNGTLEMDPADYSYHQHSPEVQADGSILVYDNGNFRPDTEVPYSRTVRYVIDDEAQTAEVVWEYKSEVDGEVAYAAFVGDSDGLSNGNVLIVDGGLLTGVNGTYAQINEVVPNGESGGEVAFRLKIETLGFGIYRAERIETLIPSGGGGRPVL